MNTPYDRIKEYLSQKGYEGADLEKAAAKATAQVEAIRVGLDPVLAVDAPAAVDAWGVVKPLTCPKCGCTIDDMEDCCPGCLH